MTVPEIIEWDCPKCGLPMRDEFWIFVCDNCKMCHPFEEPERIHTEAKK